MTQYLAALVVLLAVHAINCQQINSDLNKVDQRLLELIDMSQQLSNQLDKIIATVSQYNVAAMKLMGKLTKIEAPRCSRGRFSCGDSLQCVGRLLVCDGSSDCENGADEDTELCTYAFKNGGTYIGERVFDECTGSALNGKVFFIPIKENSLDWFPQISQMVYSAAGDIDNNRLSYGYNSRSTFKYSYSGRLIYGILKYNNLLIRGQVDAADKRLFRSYAYTKNGIDSEKPCALFVYRLMD